MHLGRVLQRDCAHYSSGPPADTALLAPGSSDLWAWLQTVFTCEPDWGHSAIVGPGRL
ncbi:hypothetical protein D3C84_1081370 [compost metagenome]